MMPMMIVIATVITTVVLMAAIIIILKMAAMVMEIPQEPHETSTSTSDRRAELPYVHCLHEVQRHTHAGSGDKLVVVVVAELQGIPSETR